MDWDKLRIFHAVASAGSFTHAGQMLTLSQSAVSRQVSALEEEISTPLFQRHARGLTLTDEGELLYSGPVSDIVKRAKTGTVVLVGVPIDQQMPAAALLSQDPNIENVATTNGYLTVSLRPGIDDFGFVAQRLIAAGYKLTLLREEEVNLETAFMRLTKGMVQ